MNLHTLQSKVALLESLVDIPSGADTPEGVLLIFKKLEEIFEALDFKVRYLANPSPHFKTPPIFVAEKMGTKHSPNKWTTLASHADTVFTLKDEFKTFSYSNGGQSATGPGVIDNKGGMVIALSSLFDFYHRQQTPQISTRFICTPNEEQGTKGFHSLLKKMGQEASFLLGFEPALPDGSFIKSRRANRWYEIKVKGRAAHSGRNFHQGINAAFEMSRKVSEINALNGKNPNVTLNIGAIHSKQDRFNVVCENASAKLDLRYTLPEEAEFFHKEILEIIENNKEMSPEDMKYCTSSYSIEDDCPPLVEHSDLSLYTEKLCSLISNIEKIKVTAKHAHAASDCNYIAHSDLLAIDGLGACGTGMHEKSESILLSSLQTRSQAVSQFLSFLNDHSF